MNETADFTRSCQNCGRPLDPANSQSAETGLCLVCAVSDAEARLGLLDDAPAQVEVSAEQKRSLAGRFVLAGISLVVAALAVAWPAIFPASGSVPPPREGTPDTDVLADECIENVAILVELEADGEAHGLAPDFACPASDAPYVFTWSVSEEPALIDVRCPNPSAHDLSSISMSAADRLPTVQE